MGTRHTHAHTNTGRHSDTLAHSQTDRQTARPDLPRSNPLTFSRRLLLMFALIIVVVVIAVDIVLFA